MSKIERQREIESDSVRDGCVRWCQSSRIPGGGRHQAVPEFDGNLVEVARGRHPCLTGHLEDVYKKAKLPAYGLPLLSIGHEQMVDTSPESSAGNYGHGRQNNLP